MSSAGASERPELAAWMAKPGRTLIAGAPEGYDAQVLGRLAAAGGRTGRALLFVARDDAALSRKAEALAFFAPAVERLEFPAWDCLPYDRVSPNPEIVSRRLDALTRLLAEPEAGPAGRILLTTVAAVLQRVPPRPAFAGRALRLAAGDRRPLEAVVDFLAGNGYARSGTVVEPGEYAVRGGILDVFPSGRAAPVRLDFFGDQVEGVRAFDPASQRSAGALAAVALIPVSEIFLDADSISRFRTAYVEQFGTAGDGDPLYRAVSEGVRHMGMEHWLPLFYERLETIFDYAPGAAVVLDHQAAEAVAARLDLIAEYYAARKERAQKGAADGAPYRPVAPERLYLAEVELDNLLVDFPVARLSPFASATAAAPDADAAGDGAATAIDAGGRPGRLVAEARAEADRNVFDAVRAYAEAERQAGQRVLVTAYSAGSRDRLGGLLAEHGLAPLQAIDRWDETTPAAAQLAVVGLERGFRAPGLTAIAEPDILGERLNRPARRRVRAENFIAEASSLAEGDLVVHVDHGIGRFECLQTVEVAGAPHDCLRLVYQGGDRLFLPVENVELVSRYGSEDAGAQLDRLGGAAWQGRKARLKNRVREMAAELIRVAAAREMTPAEPMAPVEGLYDEFCARFPYLETEDQERAIADAVDDLASARNTDRLICGDVGFGKTEVALRAAFVTALSGRQVAVVVPTTLLCRQHFATFRQRFADFPLRVEQISRLVAAKRAREVKAGLAAGTVDIVIGTHALLAKDVRFRDLGLLVVDEEQHFGVAHKEKLKKLKAEVRVLTLTATPIPRTLQLALSGLREMSLIATPPVDRLAVRTYVLPYDPVIVREAILRERYRGGQTFYVCPRISDIERVVERLKTLVPEIKVATAHGRMPARALESAVSAFADGACDLLVSTNIIEAGLDMPRVNTLVVHRAELFGLAQLYQLRGRVGRSKVRAYAYLTLPAGRQLAPTALRRLDVMQALDTLGAGLTLASHDLDIRGAGNLLGAEQSGHIREVGIELYQQMLEEAVAEARGLEGKGSEEWSPQIGLGMAVLIPDSYVADLGLRMGLYRRLARLNRPEEVEAFAAELIDRFGPLPGEAENLLQVVAVKNACRAAAVERIEAGPKGAVVSFRGRRFANPEGLVAFIAANHGSVKLRPDHKLVYMRAWEEPRERLKGVRHLLATLAEIAGKGDRQPAAQA